MLGGGEGWKGLLCCEGDARARLAQSVEHETLNLGVVGSSPTSGVLGWLRLAATICTASSLQPRHYHRVHSSAPIVLPSSSLV